MRQHPFRKWANTTISCHFVLLWECRLGCDTSQEEPWDKPRALTDLNDGGYQRLVEVLTLALRRPTLAGTRL